MCRGLALAILSLTTSPAIADEIDKLVRLPLSPGAVALLADHGSDGRIIARLKTALADRDPPVRSVAARVTAVQKIAALLPDLTQTLDGETDADAAHEELRALCTTAGETADSVAAKIAKRFSPRLDRFITLLIGRLRGIRALFVYNSELRELALSASDRVAFFELISQVQPEDALGASASFALGRSAIADWRAILTVASRRGIALPDGVLDAALRAQDPRIRGEAAWYLARAYGKRPPQQPSRIFQAIDEAPPVADPEQRFGFELLHRTLGRPAREDDEWIASLDANPICHLDPGQGSGALSDVLTDREREALAVRNWKSGRLSSQVSSATASTKAPAGKLTGLRLISGLPRGISSDLLALGGCESSSGFHFFSVADVEYRPDGLPGAVHMAPHPRAECRRTAAALFLMSSEMERERPEAPKGQFLAVFNPNALICAEEQDLQPSGSCCSELQVRRVGGAVAAPKLKTRVEPFYPIQSRKLRHEGACIYEAIVSADGCVRDIRLLKGSHPDLDAPGMEAVAQWRYEPATLNGRPVPVFLTVTVTFSLK